MMDFLHEVFKKGGALSDLLPVYRHNRLQYEYAQDVGSILLDGMAPENTAVGMLEAETGTGKSLGYLMPLGWLAAQGQRVAISTFSNYLLEQGIRESWPVVQGVIEDLLGASLRAVPRVGLRNFVSVRRAKDFIDSLENPDPALVRKFQQWLDTGSGLIQEWIDLHGALPFDMRPDAVCCKPYDSASELASYSKHLETAREADVVFTNHTLSILYIGEGRDAADPADLSHRPRRPQ